MHNDVTSDGRSTIAKMIDDIDDDSTDVMKNEEDHQTPQSSPNNSSEATAAAAADDKDGSSEHLPKDTTAVISEKEVIPTECKEDTATAVMIDGNLKGNNGKREEEEKEELTPHVHSPVNKVIKYATFLDLL